MFTFGNAAAYFDHGYYDSKHLTLNVRDNPNVFIVNNGMDNKVDYDYKEVALAAQSNVLYLSYSPSVGPYSNWPNCSVTCNDSNYKFSHYSALHCRYEDGKMTQSDNLSPDPL